jgi:signal transduction histidine kinase
METTLISETLMRILLTYCAEAALGFILFMVFLHFYRVYGRKFLRTWSWSWLSFFLHMAALSMVTLCMANILPAGFQGLFSMLTQTGSLLQISFILMGTYELIREREFPRQGFIATTGACVAVAVLSVVLFNEAAESRYFFRVGLRTFITGTGFIWAAVITAMNARFSGGVGQRLLAAGYFFYGVDQLVYTLIVLANLFGEPVPFPAYFGTLELVLVSLTGLGMVMWLLEDEREKLRKVNLELDNFLYRTSHDLRAPLASILGLVNLTRHSEDAKESARIIEMIESRIRKLDEVIRDILNLSRTSKILNRIERIDFNQVMRELYSDVKFQDGAEKIKLHYRESPGNILYSDAGRIKMILSNLLSNAVKYHRLNQEDPFIEVNFQKAGTKVFIQVIDNGQGIAKDSQEKIFDMFYRASTQSDGTGLGLYIVREAVRRLKGSISVSSKEGKGSTFTLVLEQGSPAD